MKKGILFIFLVVISFSAFSQTTSPILFSDEFDNNNNNWTVTEPNAKGYSAQIINGMYVIKTKKDAESFYLPFPLSSSKDYTFEVPFLVEPLSSFVELFFYNYRGELIGFNLYMTGKEYSIYKVKDGVNSFIRNYKSAAACFPPAVSLKTKVLMRIEKKGNQTSFFINGIKLETITDLVLPGNKLGFMIGQNSKVSIDRFTVMQNNTPGINLTNQSTQKIKRQHLGSEVNTKAPELGPFISADGKQLYFNRRDYYDNPNAHNECDDIWYSEIQPDSSWGKAQKFGLPINDEMNNDIIAVSPDNNTLFMADKSCDPTSQIKFWVSHRTTTGWSAPTSMNVANGYNLDKYSEATLSVDGKTIIIAIRRNDTEGETDMYVCFLGPDSVWSEPKNLGKKINTLGQDFAPFLAADNVTLYYSTDGLAGYGSEDVFISRRLDDTWTNWSDPENLGPNINSSSWDAYYSVNASGTYAFVNSTEVDSTREDIFQIKLTSNKPKPVVVVEGKVLDGKTKLPLAAMITYELLPDGKEAGLARSNPATGEYRIILPYGKTYGYHAEAKGYIPVNENFDLQEEKEYVEITKDLLLIPIEVGQTIKLNNVFFVQSKAEMLPSSYPELDRLVGIMKSNPSMEIELRGYTDNNGDPKKNIELSQQRVTVVKNYLISRGIPAKNVEGKGFGGANPIADNSKEETRKLNRRVEFVILKN